MRFEKSALPIDEQINRLKNRGMIFADEQYARRTLEFISYFRLKAYWLPFEDSAELSDDRAFLEGTRFEDVMGLYFFDRELRFLVLGAIEIFEVALRAQWAHHMATRHDPHDCFLAEHYSDPQRHSKLVSELSNGFTRSFAPFADHYRKKYTAPELPPAWMAVETMTFGTLSKFYSGLKSRKDRQAIAKSFGVNEIVLKSFAHHANFVRNICAHHSRLWNRQFTITMKVPKYPVDLNEAMCCAKSDRLHNTLIMLDYMVDKILCCTGLKDNVLTLLQRCPVVDPAKDMGFADQWRSSPVWRTKT